MGEGVLRHKLGTESGLSCHGSSVQVIPNIMASSGVVRISVRKHQRYHPYTCSVLLRRWCDETVH